MKEDKPCDPARDCSLVRLFLLPGFQKVISGYREKSPHGWAVIEPMITFCWLFWLEMSQRSSTGVTPRGWAVGSGASSSYKSNRNKTASEREPSVQKTSESKPSQTEPNASVCSVEAFNSNACSLNL